MDERVCEAVVVVEAGRADGGRIGVTVQLVVGRTSRPLVSWDGEAVPDGPPVVAATRSPDRSRVAVLVGGELSGVDLRDGARVLLDRRVDWPPLGDGVLAWDEHGPVVVAVDAPGPRRVPLPDGRTLVLDAPVSADDGFSGGDQGSTAGLAMPPGTAEDEVLRARDELHAALDEQALVERRAWARVEGPHAPALLFDEVASGVDGSTGLHWPVSSGPSGTIVRRSTTRFVGEGSDDTRIDRPWLIGPDGAVTTLDVRLGNAPLCELPDGRWLLPGADALWCDSGDEPLHALGPDGRPSPWDPDGTVSTLSLLRTVAPELLPATPPENLDDSPWATAARLSGDGRRVVLLITDVPWSPVWDATDDVAWAVVEVSADGAGRPTLLAQGRRTSERFAAIAL